MTSPVRLDRKAVWGWALYDFANSAFTTLVVTFIYSAYFTQSIAESVESGTALWSRAVTITAILIAILSPALGAVADQGGLRKRLLLIFTVISVLSTAMLFTAQPGEVYLALFWFIVADIAFEMGIVFNNAFLPDIAPKDKIGSISGFGWALGYVGGLLALFIALGMVFPADAPFFGVPTENGFNIRATNLLVALWFAVFSIPLFVLVPEVHKKSEHSLRKIFRNSYKELMSTFHEMRRYRQIIRFLLARLVYNDGLVTIFAFGGIYASGTFGFTFPEIILFGIVLNVTAGLGAYVFGHIDDRIGAKKTIMISIFGLGVATVLAVFAPNKMVFWAAGIIIGIFSGPNQAASRSLMARFVPDDKETEFFGFYAFSGKATAFLGPMLLGVLTEVWHSQRAGVAVLILFFVVGAWLLSRVDEQEGIAAAENAG